MSYRDDLAALTARHAALTGEAADKARELAEAAALLEQARVKSRLPILDNIKVASPCHASWDAMTGDDRVRHCGSCEKKVYNLSEMTRDEAQALLIEKEGRLCVRYFRRSDGTIMTKDCSVGVARRRRQKIVAGAAAALAAVGATGVAMRAVATCDPSSLPPAEAVGVLAVPAPPPPMMGAIAPTPPPPDDLIMGEMAMPEPEELKGKPSFEMGDVAAPAPR